MTKYAFGLVWLLALISDCTQQPKTTFKLNWKRYFDLTLCLQLHNRFSGCFIFLSACKLVVLKLMPEKVNIWRDCKCFIYNARQFKDSSTVYDIRLINDIGSRKLDFMIIVHLIYIQQEVVVCGDWSDPFYDLWKYFTVSLLVQKMFNLVH